MPKKGYKQTKKHKKNLSLSHLGQIRSQKTIDKWKKSIKKYKQTDETIQKRKQSFLNWMENGRINNLSDYNKFIKNISILGKKSKGRKLSEEYKHKIRKTALNYLKDVRHIKWPCIGKQETQILNNLEKCFNYTILRQYQTEGYFLDGYCPALNLAIEVDEKHHNNNKQEDKFRENKIKEELNCRFLRINA